MKILPGIALLAILSTAPIAAQDFTTDFYAGVLGGISPTYGPDAKLWEDSSALFSAGAFGGVNFRSGGLLFGVEGSVASDFGKTNTGEWVNSGPAVTLPRFRSSTFVPGAPVSGIVVTTGTAPGGQLSFSELNYSYVEVKARPAVVARVGISHGSWTIFGKAGVGAALLSSTSVRDQSASVYCGAFATRITTSPNGAMGNNIFVEDTACLNPTSGPVTTTDSNQWTPTLTYGIGAELDLDRYFGRGEIEMTNWGLNGGISGMTRVNLGAGVRF